MMEQYKKETSQIHAPTDLIRRTKEAMREEEQRLARESVPPSIAERTKRSYGRVYKWVLPTAVAAVLCIVILSIGVTGIGGRVNKSASDIAESTADSGSVDIANDGAIDMAAVETAEAEGANDIGMLLGEAYAEEEATEAAGAPIGKNETMMTNDVQKSDQDVMSGRDADNHAWWVVKEGNYSWKIREVDKIPSADDHTVSEEHISVQGIDVLVVYDMDDIWCAYATGDDGKLYLIFTEAAADEFSVEEFADMAYDRLMETVEKTK